MHSQPTSHGSDARPSSGLRGLLAIDFPAGRAQPNLFRWLLATVVAIGVSLAACRGLVVAGIALFPATASYGHFQFSDYAKLTVIGVFGASVAWPLVTLVSSRGRRLYLWLAIAVTVVGLAPDVWILHQGQPVAGVAVLVVMHFALAVITYPALVFIAPQRASFVARARTAS
ncbi:MAG: hypothetical protein JWQ39_2866 [Glaciihabitans sp.]|nr:hypothetical protein [Glaciihabitans sp.]